jgi:hypothetical protein
MMKIKRVDLIVKALLVVAGAVTLAHASDRVAVYARVDKVVLEPSAGSPDTIQVWGVFSIAAPENPNGYLPAARGYLYFKLAGHRETARKEWADLKQVAGTDQIVSFGGRFELRARVRKPGEQPHDPDPYAVSVGLTKVRGDTDYQPVRALLNPRD